MHICHITLYNKFQAIFFYISAYKILQCKMIVQVALVK